jgi:hypothetical protein
MHQGSLRKKRVNTCFPQAVFCQSGKLRRTGEKRSSLRSPNGKGLKALVEVGHLLKEASISPCLQHYHIKQQGKVSDKSRDKSVC